MNVLMDTNIYVADYRLSGSDFRLFDDASPRLGIQLLISDLIIEEVIGKFGSQLDEFFITLQSQTRKFKRFSTSALEYSINISQEKELFSRRFRARLVGWPVRHLPYPVIGHEPLVRRAIQRRKPFDDKGSGYRDALIWETLLDTLQQDEAQLVFITQNISEFCKDESLHSDLLEDLDRFGISGDRIRLFTSLSAFNKEIVLPGLSRLDDLFDTFAGDQVQGFSLRDWAEHNLIDLLRDGDWGEVLVHLEDTCARVYESELLGIEKFDIDDVRQLCNGDILLSATLYVQIELSVDASRDEILRSSELQGIFGDEDLSFSSATTWVPVAEYVEMRFILESETMRVLSAEVDGASGGSHAVRVQDHYIRPASPGLT